MSDRSSWDCDDWQAICDHQPGPNERTIQVSGRCEFPTTGWTAVLEHDNAGINPDPDTLYLRLRVGEPRDPQSDVTDTQDVLFEQPVIEEYLTVEINHGQTATIPVQHPE